MAAPDDRGVLIAALIGGGVYGILLLVRGSGGKVKVYPIMEFCTNYADDQAETQGLVKPDKMQSIYVSETQKITKYYVHEGDTVKIGDPILSYDTTLTDLQLERARISVQKLEIALDEANANLVKVNNYRLYVPQPDPIPDEEPGYAAHAGGGSVFPRRQRHEGQPVLLYLEQQLRL